MYANKKLFDIYKPRNDGDVFMTNGSKGKVIKKGTIKIKVYNEAIQTDSDVRFVPNLRKYLI